MGDSFWVHHDARHGVDFDFSLLSSEQKNLQNEAYYSLFISDRVVTVIRGVFLENLRFFPKIPKWSRMEANYSNPIRWKYTIAYLPLFLISTCQSRPISRGLPELIPSVCINHAIVLPNRFYYCNHYSHILHNYSMPKVHFKLWGKELTLKFGKLF